MSSGCCSTAAEGADRSAFKVDAMLCALEEAVTEEQASKRSEYEVESTDENDVAAVMSGVGMEAALIMSGMRASMLDIASKGLAKKNGVLAS